MTTVTAQPATDKQIGLIKKLLNEKRLSGLDAAVKVDAFFVREGGEVGKARASKLIDALLALPAKPVTAPSNTGVPVTLTEGVYVVPADGSIVKAKKTRDGKRLYAMAMCEIGGERLTLTGQIVHWEWRFAPGLIKHLRPEWIMSAEVAHDLGIKIGRCLWCGRRLKAASSVAASLGPVCAKRFA